MKQKHFIDSHKGLTWLALLVMMAVFDRWESETAWLYLALHGGYGLLWVLKSRLFGDKNWEQATTLRYGLVIWGGLTLYWGGGFIIMWRDVRAPAWLLGVSTLLFTLGVFLHFTADMQKYVALKLKPGTLITEGVWAYCRNPNYINSGE